MNRSFLWPILSVDDYLTEKKLQVQNIMRENEVMIHNANIIGWLHCVFYDNFPFPFFSSQLELLDWFYSDPRSLQRV